MKRRDLLKTAALLPAAAALTAVSAPARERDCPGTGDLGVVIERATGSVLIVNTTRREILGRVEGLGDLYHAP